MYIVCQTHLLASNNLNERSKNRGLHIALQNGSDSAMKEQDRYFTARMRAGFGPPRHQTGFRQTRRALHYWPLKEAVATPADRLICLRISEIKAARGPPGGGGTLEGASARSLLAPQARAVAQAKPTTTSTHLYECQADRSLERRQLQQDQVPSTQRVSAHLNAESGLGRFPCRPPRWLKFRQDELTPSMRTRTLRRKLKMRDGN